MVTSNSGVYLAVQIYSLGKTNSNVVIKKKKTVNTGIVYTPDKKTHSRVVT